MVSYDAIQSFHQELSERFFRSTQIDLRFFERSDIDPDSDLIPVPGAITVFFSRDEGILRHLADALEMADAEALTRIRSEVAERTVRRARRSGYAALEAIRTVESVFDIRYRDRTLWQDRALPEGEVLGSALISWTGGPLATDVLTAFEYVQHEESGPQYKFLAYARAPFLTDLERRMLERFPSDVAEIQLSTLVEAETKTFDEVAKVVDDAVHKAEQTRTCGPDLLDRFQQVLEAGAISPEATVKELVKARLELMTRSQLREQ